MRILITGKNGQLGQSIKKIVDERKFPNLINYEFVFIDCPPTISSLLYAGLSAAQWVLVPIKPDFLSTIGLPLLDRIITKEYPSYINRPDWMKALSVMGLVYNMVDNRLRMTKESISDVQKDAEHLGYNIFKSSISHSTKFAWSSKRTLPIFRSEPSSRYTMEIQKLVDEFIERFQGLNNENKRQQKAL